MSKLKSSIFSIISSILRFLPANKITNTFIGYKNDYKIRSFYKFLQKMRERAKNCSGDIRISF